jgi:hypothetical protein
MSPTYWKLRKQKLLERSLKGVAERSRKRAERMAGLPVREWLCFRRITDEAVYRTRRIIELWSCTDESGRIHQEIRENGHPTRFRSWRSAMRSLGMIQ